MKIVQKLLFIIVLISFASCNNNSEQKTEVKETTSKIINQNDFISIADSLKEKRLYREANSFLYRARANTDSAITLININNKLAYNYRRIGKYDSALISCYNSIKVSKLYGVEDDLTLAKSYYMLGMLYRESIPDSAYKYLTKCLKIRKNVLGDKDPLVGDVYNNIGVVFINKNNYTKAIEYYEKALKLRKQRGLQHSSVGSTYMNIANAYQTMGEYEKSLNYFDTSLTIQKNKNVKNNTRVAAILANMANTYDNLGMIDKGIELNNEALRILKNAYGDEHPYVAIVYNNLAVQSNKWGDYKGAKEYLLESIRIKKKNEKKFRNELLDNYINLGETYITLKSFDEAIKILHKGLTICEELNNSNPYTTTLLLFFLSDAYLLKHQPDSAIMYAEQGLEIIMKNFKADTFEAARGNYKISYLYLKTNNLSKAKKHANKALMFFKKKPKEYLSWIVHSEMIKGEIYFKKEKYKKSVDLLIKLRENFIDQNGDLDLMKIQKFGLSYLFIDLEYLNAQNYFELYRLSHKKDFLQKAVNTIREAEKIFENIRFTTNNEKSKIILSQKMENVFNFGMEVLYTLNVIKPDYICFETALNFAENNKSLSLLESISEKQIAKFAGIPDSILIKKKRLQSLINSNERKIEEIDNNSEEAENIQAKLFALKHDLENFNKMLESEFTNYKSLIYTQKEITLNLIRERILKKNQTLIEYSLAGNRLYTFIVSENDFRFIKTELSDNIGETVNNLTESITLNKKSEFNNCSYKLYQYLIKPCEKYIKTDRVLIINDEILGYIPYDALISSEVDLETSYKDYPYLLNKYSFGYAFSIGILSKSESVNNFVNSFVGIAPFANRNN